MHPEIHVGFAPILIAVIASFLFGWLWHGPLFGKMWARLMNISTDVKPDMGKMIGPMIIGLVGTFLMAFVMVHSIEIWRPSVWGVGQDQAFYVYGFFAGFFNWIGFVIPLLLNGVAWENRSWKLFVFSASYHFINMQIIGMILAYW